MVSVADYAEAIKSDTFVRLVVGESNETFLVPRSHIVYGWGKGEVSEVLFSQLVHAENEVTAARNEALSPTNSSRSRRNSITEALSPRSWKTKLALTRRESKKESRSKSPKVSGVQSPVSEVPEIKLPLDDAAVWCALLFWLMSPTRLLPQLPIEKDLFLVRCWNLGAKYGFVGFADTAMKALLLHFDRLEGPTIKSSVSDQAIQATFCSERPGMSTLRELISEEVIKSKLFDKCRNFQYEGHNPKKCQECREDRIEITKRFRCNVPPGRRDSHTCGLESVFWHYMVHGKTMYYTNKRSKFYKRFDKGPDGHAPWWLAYFVSSQWHDVESIVEGRPIADLES